VAGRTRQHSLRIHDAATRVEHFISGTLMDQFFKSATHLSREISSNILEEIEEIFSSAASPAVRRTGARTVRQPVISHFCSPNIFTPRYYIWAAWVMGRHSLDTLPFMELIANACIPEWVELRNKLEAFSLFEHVDMELSLLAFTDQSLAALARQAEVLGPYFSVWATEGIGHYYADSHLSSDKPVRSLLQATQDNRLPTAALVPLHAGIGLTLAESVLAKIDGKTYDQVNSQIRDFVNLCRSTVHPEYLEIIYEALGLATRNLYPHLLSTMQTCLSDLSEELPEYFWHGVGRALYFSPSTLFSRDASGKGFDMCMTEPPNDLARRNAIAGFAWALTLVNMRQPKIITAFLRRHGSTMVEHEAFVNGVRSALIIWTKSSSNTYDLNRLKTYQGEKITPDLNHLWNIYIGEACRDASLYCSSDENKHLGKLFRYEPDPPFSHIAAVDHQRFTTGAAHSD
jgi:hypothetical protein